MRLGQLSVLDKAIDWGIAAESVRRWMRKIDIDNEIKNGLPIPSSPNWSVVCVEMVLGDEERCPVPRSGALRFLNPPEKAYQSVRSFPAEGFPVRPVSGLLGFPTHAFPV